MYRLILLLPIGVKFHIRLVSTSSPPILTLSKQAFCFSLLQWNSYHAKALWLPAAESNLQYLFSSQPFSSIWPFQFLLLFLSYKLFLISLVSPSLTPLKLLEYFQVPYQHTLRGDLTQFHSFEPNLNADDIPLPESQLTCPTPSQLLTGRDLGMNKYAVKLLMFLPSRCIVPYATPSSHLN